MSWSQSDASDFSARHVIGLESNFVRNHRENELKAENPNKSDISLKDRPRSST